MEAELSDGALDALDFASHIVRVVLDPGADHGCGGGLALLRLAVVAGLCLQRTFGRGQVTIRCWLIREPMARSTPGLGEGCRTGEQALAEDLDGERARPAPALRTAADEVADGRTERIECVREFRFPGVSRQG